MHTPLQRKLEKTCLSQGHHTLSPPDLPVIQGQLPFNKSFCWELGKAKAYIEEVMGMGRVGHSGVHKWPKAWPLSL